jgi:hypothetical protein
MRFGTYKLLPIRFWGVSQTGHFFTVITREKVAAASIVGFAIQRQPHMPCRPLQQLRAQFGLRLLVDPAAELGAPTYSSRGSKRHMPWHMVASTFAWDDPNK